MQGKVEICGVNTSKLKVLKSGEMRELLIRAHDGDKGAREKLIWGRTSGTGRWECGTGT